MIIATSLSNNSVIVTEVVWSVDLYRNIKFASDHESSIFRVDMLS